ncbi:MAG TPA: ATP-binding protein [Bryobacteraceae bacterium]|nr:ATP-binding protein [Bryobacteraceae bacterium]
MRPRPSLLWKISLSTSIAITLLLAVAGYFVQDQTRSALSRNLELELQGSFRAYESLWRARADLLAKVSLVFSKMQYVRAAFQTNDRATITDTAGEIWSQVSQSNNAIFLVTDPSGEVIASLGGKSPQNRNMYVVRDALPRFPAQSEGFTFQNNQLYEVVVTPVYVATGGGDGLIDVLVAGFPVDQNVASELRERTGGSDFVFLENGRPVASTLPSSDTSQIAAQYRRGAGLQHLELPNREYAVFGSPLRDIAGAPAGDLLIVHNFDAIRRDLQALELKLVFAWAAAILAGIGVSILLARRILKPVRQLDEAAALIAEQKYETRVPEGGDDELGRLARTFNAMCRSIQDAREELIRQERISTIGRLSSSIVHDLRNPLAAIYGGAEMMMDGDLSTQQSQRIAGNIYRSSRAIKDMLQELVDVSRGRIQAPERCRLSEVIGAAVEAQAASAEQHGIEIRNAVDSSIEVPVEPGRMERVFLNLISNSIEAMPDGGRIDIAAHRNGHDVLVCVDDTGPGVPPSVRQRLFQPFVTSGKNGLGLGLALSRQAVLDHGGDLWIEDAAAGAHFRLRLPFGEI